MINTTEPMMLEFEFIINGSTGSYLMEFDNSDLIRERLEYKILKIGAAVLILKRIK